MENSRSEIFDDEKIISDEASHINESSPQVVKSIPMRVYERTTKRNIWRFADQEATSSKALTVGDLVEKVSAEKASGQEGLVENLEEQKFDSFGRDASVKTTVLSETTSDQEDSSDEE